MSTTSKGHYIAGRWAQGQGSEFLSVSPSDDHALWNGRCATTHDTDAAVLAASDAFNSWSKLELSERSAYLHAFVDVLKTNKVVLADCIASEVGKPRWEAATEVAAMIGKLDPTEQSYRERNSDSSRQQANGIARTRFRPHGVVAVLGPYNFPGHMPNGHIMPALLAGNTIIFKPSEKTPAVAEQTVEYWARAGLPPGVLNLLQGDASVGQHLCQHPGVKGIFFTGSRHVGESIRALTSVDKICVLEMGGNSPLIVWDASDIDAAVFATIQSAFITSGQRCSAARRLIVPSNSFGETLLSRLVSSTRRIRVGRHNETPEPYMGPLRLPSMVDHLLQEQERLISRGALPLLKCEPLPLGHSFVTPGILDVTPVNPREDEEIIGPFLQVIQVTDFDSALNEANNTKYGLAAGLFTEDARLYDRFKDVVRAGILNWNQQLTGASPWAPFGGIKHSGNFRPSGYLASDYCVYSMGSIELGQLALPPELPPGFSFEKTASDGPSDLNRR
jgi:succinylglutamic semialdehyde dehydrogenase